MIYADNAATTKISELALVKMLPFLQEQYGNASSQYSLGISAKQAITQARQRIADVIGAEPTEIIFTSGGSEANSWVLRGVADVFREEKIHIITTSIEHRSILNTCSMLESRDVEVTYLPPGNDGIVCIESLKSAIRPNTKLVSIMLANNEIGTIQPIGEIGMFLRENGIWLHTDAVQAIGHIPVNVDSLHIDFLSASAHKFNGAKGTGFLYKRTGIDLPTLIFGGNQEQGIRAGTENVAGIVALGYALEESASNMFFESEKQKAFVVTTIEGLRKTIPNIRINVENSQRLPGIVSISFPYVSGESIAHILNSRGICVSTGSACNSGKDYTSHVLLAIGLSEQEVRSSIRISYGRYNTLEEVNEIVKAITNVYNKILSLNFLNREC